MNALQEHIADYHLNEIVTMNQLQDCGVISDNCVEAVDVADGDAGLARLFLLGAYHPGKAREALLL